MKWNDRGQKKHAKQIAYLRLFEEQLFKCDKVLQENCPCHNFVVHVDRGITISANFGLYWFF